MTSSVIVLCGGRGTRAYPHTVDLPKPLLEVDGRPILHHVLELFRRQGDFDFVLAAGFRSDLVAGFAVTLAPLYRVRVIDSGLDANTADRVRACRDGLSSTFVVTYGDGVGNVDVEDLLAFHRSHRGPATITTVPLPSQYGTVECGPDGLVTRFREKPVLADHWINGGFLVFEQAIWDHLAGADLEKQVLPALARRGLLHAYRHHGFWKSMDTYKDGLELTALARREGPAPWFENLPPMPEMQLSATGDTRLAGR